MARSVRDTRLETRQARIRLAVQAEPHWRGITEGCHLGYYKGQRGGAWIARYRGSQGGAYSKKRLGAADDVNDADGITFLSYKQAQEAAQEWFTDKRTPPAAPPITPYTVATAADDYMAAYEAGQTPGGGKGKTETAASIKAFIKPKLGDKVVSELTTADIEAWHRELAATPPRQRHKAGKDPVYRAVDMTDEEVIRRRRASANRILTVLKAILNRVPREKHGGNEHAWSDVSPFGEVDSPTVRWLEPPEAKRLLNSSPEDLRALATAALLTGARYSELGRLCVRDYSATGKGIHIRRAKAQKPRFVHVTDEGQRFFKDQCAGKGSDDLIFTRAGGSAWGKSEQHRPIQDACKVAKIEPAVGFHILRHSYGSWLAMRGVPMGVIAAQLGHADTRMTERHYAHLAPSYVADTVRSAFGEMGLAKASNVTAMTPEGSNELNQAALTKVVVADATLRESAEELSTRRQD